MNEKIKLMNEILEQNNYIVKVIYNSNCFLAQQKIKTKDTICKIKKCKLNDDFNIMIDNITLHIDIDNNGWFFNGYKSISAFNL